MYSLVLDLDETLIHYEFDDAGEDYYLIRPGALMFLKELSFYYEIIIFTAAMPEVSAPCPANCGAAVRGQNPGQPGPERAAHQAQALPAAHDAHRRLRHVSCPEC